MPPPYAVNGLQTTPMVLSRFLFLRQLPSLLNADSLITLIKLYNSDRAVNFYDGAATQSSAAGAAKEVVICEIKYFEMISKLLQFYISHVTMSETEIKLFQLLKEF